MAGNTGICDVLNSKFMIPYQNLIILNLKKSEIQTLCILKLPLEPGSY